MKNDYREKKIKSIHCYNPFGEQSGFIHQTSDPAKT